MTKMDLITLRKRQQQYAVIQFFVLISSIPLLFFFVIAFHGGVLWLTYGSGTALVLLATTHNFFYFRQLGVVEINQRSAYVGPFVVLSLAILPVLAIMLPASILSAPLGDSTTRIILSFVVTAIIGGIVVLVPASLQKNALDVSEKFRVLEETRLELDKSLVEATQRVIRGEEESNPEMLRRIYRLEDSVRLIAMVLSREALARQARPAQFFRYFSLVIGPLLSAVFSYFLK